MDEICLDASKAGMEARPMLLRCDEIFKASSIAMAMFLCTDAMPDWVEDLHHPRRERFWQPPAIPVAATLPATNPIRQLTSIRVEQYSVSGS